MIKTDMSVIVQYLFVYLSAWVPNQLLECEDHSISSKVEQDRTAYGVSAVSVFYESVAVL
ncbi:MAG: hypothetical protein CBE43_05140 [Rhodopirellula sp. TMED283]|nr:MAG: hypothetical protein CBE43_05140 [Rhodopirellula sp. TMED283]